MFTRSTRKVAASNALPTIILHIGRQKTATTSIQRFLANNAEALAEEGIYYPTTGRVQGRAPAHHELAIALNARESDGESVQKLYEQFHEEIDGRPEQVIILSSEAFQRIRDLSVLSTFLKDRLPVVVCYLREPFAAKQSAWAQSIHATRQSATFEDFARHSRLHYKNFVCHWRKFASRLELGLFERQRLHGNDAVADFLVRIGYRDFADRSLSLVRDDGLPSIGGNLLYVKRMINLARADKPNLTSEFDALSELASLEPRWRGRWFVETKTIAQLRKVDQADRRYLDRMFGDVKTSDPSDAPVMPDWSMLQEDTRRILSEPSLNDAFSPLGLILQNRTEPN